MTEMERGTVLVGMMGSGKSTLGRGLAEHFRQPFVDTDKLIERQFGKTCAQLVDDGNFSAQQTEVILAHKPTSPEVIATGGSVPMYPELVRHLGGLGVGIFIDVDSEALEARLPSSRIAALNNPKGLSFGDLYRERAEFYKAAAELVLHVPGDEAADVTLDRIIDLRTKSYI